MRSLFNTLLVSVSLVAACGEPTEPDGTEGDGGTFDAARDATLVGADGAVVHDAASAAIDPALAALALPRPAAPPPDVTNRFADDPAAAELGRVLFFDPSFAGRLLDGDNDGSERALGNVNDTGRVSCASCHVPQDGFSDTRSLRQQISLAAGWGRRKAPSLLDVAHSPLLMWDGSHDTMWGQIFAVIESPVEMNSSRLYAAQRIYASYRTQYEAVFGAMPMLDDNQRFPALSAERTGCSAIDQNERVCTGEWHGVPGDGAEFDGMAAEDQAAVTRIVVNVGKAMAAYQRLLRCGESRFDLWVRGEDPGALTPQEQRGAALFVGKGNCVSCHTGPYFSDEQFHNVGLKPAIVATVFLDDGDEGASAGLLAAQRNPLNSKGAFSDGDDGRLPAALEPALLGAFRTPKLRCISKRPSFMHTAQFRALDDVLSFFVRGGDPVGYPGENELTPLNLTPDERSDVVAFLLALDGPGPSAALLSR